MGRSHVRTRRDADPAGYGFDLETAERPFDPRRLFDRAPDEAPLEVEIGSGKGSFLVAESELRPDALFLGIERARRYWLYAADRLRRRERPNARIVRGDAREVLEAMPERSICGLHMYFPDPWPKRRHAHRRLLIQPEFLTACERVLAAGTPIRVVTDDPEYFDQIEAALAARPKLVRSRYEPPASANEGELAGSNFERKYRLEGRRIQAVAAVRSADEDDALANEQA
ncbi:MAG: hypothetical protein OXU35_00270 [Acidobacteriota bacterium]|nr:hypothetical protein [Acidobacteriota bacterium]